MKSKFSKVMRLFFALSLVSCILLVLPFNVSAASTETQDGLEVTIITDKTEYAADEDLRISVSIKNNNSYKIEDISVETLLPDGLELKNGNLSATDIDIEAGSSYSTSVVTQLSENLKNNKEETEQKEIIMPNDDNEIENPQTGDTNVVVWILLLVVAVVGIILTVKFKKTTQMMCLILCLAMLLSILPMSVFATENDTDTITVDKTIIVDKKEYLLSANVFFTDNGNLIILSNFTSDEVYFACDIEEQVTFTVQASANVVDVDLYMDDEKIGKMFDDGTHGDKCSNDGVYTYSYMILSNTEKECTYYAVAENKWKSEKLTIRFFDSLTKKDYETFVSVFEEIKHIEEKYLDMKGEVDETNIEPCFLDVENYVKELKKQGIVYCYETYIVDEKFVSITIKLESGLQIVFVPPNGDNLSSGKQLTIMSQIKSYISTELQSTAEDLLQLSVNGMNDLGYTHIWIKDEGVTLDTFNKMGKDQVILWSGHGVPTKKCTYLQVQESYNKILFWIGSPIASTVALVRSGMTITSDGFLAVNYKYLEENLPDLSGSFVYLLSCTSGDDYNLCNTFINKGAVSLVAVHNSIDADYGLVMQSSLGALLTKINSKTNNYYTVSEAMMLCYENYGYDDGKGAFPFVYLGGTLKGNYRIVNASVGTLSGKICKASDRIKAIPNASIEVYKNGVLYTSSTSNSTGNYTINLPTGRYQVKISSEGYIDFKAYATVTATENKYIETFLLIEGSEAELGIAGGQVVNSITGEGAACVTLTIKKDWNNTDEASEIVKTAITDTNGSYSVELPLGNYTVIATKDGYTASSFNIIVQEGATGNQNGIITPLVTGDDYLITLTWGANPRDLDSHVEGVISNGSKFHVYYSHRSQHDGDIEVCNLDYDDTTSYGPEKITLNATNDTPYYYYVYKFAGSGTLGDSEAKVIVQQGNTLNAEFNVPTDLGDAKYWNVFAIKNGELIINNTITSTPNLEYAN